MTELTVPEGLPGWIEDHIRQYLEDPDAGHNWDSTAVGGPGVLPTLLLVTKGRKTGRTSILPLIYGKHENAYVIIASKGGAPAHPAWYLNLLAQAECEIKVAHDQMNVVARTASGEERAALWRQLAEIYPEFAGARIGEG